MSLFLTTSKINHRRRFYRVSSGVLSAILFGLNSALAQYGTTTPGAPQKGTGGFAPPPAGDYFEDDYYEDEYYPPAGGAYPPAGGAYPPPAANNYAYPAAPAPYAPPPAPSAPSNTSRSVTTGRGSSPSGNEVPDPRRVNGGMAVGGGQPNGVVIASNKPPQIPVDTDTGKGGTEIVTDFNFKDADILDIAKTLGKLTGKNFIFDDDVKGKVTIISNSPITVTDAWRAYLTALEIKGFAHIPSGKYVRIARKRDARDKQISTYTGEASPDSDALITRIFPLKYISAEDVQRVFRNFLPAEARIVPYEQTNTVIVTDSGSNIAKLAKMLELLDVEGYDAGIEVLPVRYASANELAKLVDQLLPGTIAAPKTPGMPAGGFARPGGSGFTARRTKEGGIINTIIADERTNSLIIHANTRGYTQVKGLIEKLDKKRPAQTGGGKIHVIYLQFADSESIATTLNTLSQGAQSKAPANPMGGGIGINPNDQALFEGNIKVSPDKSTNSLVVTASPTDFVTVQRVVNRLDIPRDEVYVEMVIMELKVNRGHEFGVNLMAPTGNGLLSMLPGSGSIQSSDLANLLMNNLPPGGVASLGLKAGPTRTVDIGGKPVALGSVNAIVKALSTTGQSNILSTPQIMMLDNTEGKFEAGGTVPVKSQTISATTAPSVASYTQLPIKMTVKVKPQISKHLNFVKLDVDAEINDVDGSPAEIGAPPATTLRSAKTSIVVADGDTAVIGGLMKDKVNESVSKVPLLGDIPILGWLFSSRTKNTEKINLLIFMTPHIVRQYEKVRSILDRKLAERDKAIERDNGGEDLHRWKRDDIIRSLPDIKDISTYKNRHVVNLDEDEENEDPWYFKSTDSSAPTGPVKRPSAPATPAAPSSAPPSAPINSEAPAPSAPDSLPASGGEATP